MPTAARHGPMVATVAAFWKRLPARRACERTGFIEYVGGCVCVGEDARRATWRNRNVYIQTNIHANQQPVGWEIVNARTHGHEIGTTQGVGREARGNGQFVLVCNCS